MIRLRMEIHDERQLVLAALRPPPPIYVNTKSRKDFRVIRQTCFGAVDEERYSVSTLKSYIDELYELQESLFYIEDGLMTLLLWRGSLQWTIPVLQIEVDLPIHSISAFVTAVFLVENPNFVPSFCFGSLAWLLLAIGGYRQGAENVWWRCHSYTQIFKMLALGDDFAEAHKIKPFENFEAAKKEAEDWVRRIEASEQRAAQETAEAAVAEEERQKELAGLGDEADTDLGTKVGQGGISFDPVRVALYPIQQMLGIVVRGVRIVKNVFTWQEAYFSFWVTTGSLVLSILSLFVPWFWCLKWGSRIFAWTVFGPWMKLVDVYYFSLIEPETEEQRQRRQQAEKLRQKLAHSELVTQTRIVREDATKQRAVKSYMFGKFALRIPILKQDRYADIPLAESFARPYAEKDFSLAKLAMDEAGYNTTRIPGQTLIGDMIPYVKEEDFTLAPTGKAALHTEKLSKNAPGAGATLVTNPSKIAAAVGVAVVATYFGTPLVANLLSKADKWVSSEL